MPSLGTGEVVGIGEGMPLPVRLTFRKLPANLVPASETAGEKSEHSNMSRGQVVRLAIERWRNATTGQATHEEDASRGPVPSIEPAQDAIARGLEAIEGERPPAEQRRLPLDPRRYSILKR